MKHLKYFFLIPIYIVLIGCNFGSTPQPAIPGVVDRDDDYYDKRRTTDKDRDDVITSSQKRYRGPKCSGDDDCEKICKDIYRSRNDKKDCEDLSISQVEALDELHETLEDPDLKDLEDLDVRDFDVYVNISIAPLDKLASRYNSREAREFLAWLALNSEVVRVFEKEDDNYEILEALLEEVGGVEIPAAGTSGRDDKILEDALDGLKKNLEDGETFLGLAVSEDNIDALQWVHDYLEDQQCDNNIDTTACLRKYCEIGRAMDEDSADDLFDYEYFENYLEDLVDDNVRCASDTEGEDDKEWTGSACPAGSTDIWKSDYKDIKEVDDWYDDLCD